MEKRIQLKTVMFGVALAALISARPILAQCVECSDPCNGTDNPCFTLTFDAAHETNKYDFGTHFIKITANVLQPFDVSIEFVPISSSPYPNPDLDDRLNIGFGPANCIPYDGATSNTIPPGQCGYYHVLNPVPQRDVDFSGDVLYKVFWDYPTLDQLNNVRLYRAPFPEEDPQTCPNLSECYTQDITGTVYPSGATGNGDPGIGGKSKGFSDYEVVDRIGNDLTAKVKIGLKKDKDTGILFDLKAVVKKNGNEVSSGELLGVPGGGKGFDLAKLRTIPLSFPTELFAPNDNISLKVLVRDSCLASPQPSGVARLWYDDNSQSQVNEEGVTTAGDPTPLPSLYLVRGDDDEDENCDHERDRGDLSTSPGTKRKKRDVKVQAPVPSCDGPYRSFGKWSGTVPY